MDYRLKIATRDKYPSHRDRHITRLVSLQQQVIDAKQTQALNAIELDNLKTLQSELDRELSAVTMERNSAIGEKFLLQTQLNGESVELQRQQEELEDQLAGIKVARANLMEEVEGLKDELEGLDRMIAMKDAEIGRLNREMEKASKELDALGKQSGVKLPEPSKRPSIMRMPSQASTSRGISFQAPSKNASAQAYGSRSLNNSTESRSSVKFE